MSDHEFSLLSDTWRDCARDLHHSITQDLHQTSLARKNVKASVIHTLIRDVVAVVSGLRTGAQLNYMPYAPSETYIRSLRSLCLKITDAISKCIRAAQPVMLVECDGCILVLSKDALAQFAEQARPLPRGIGFDLDNKGILSQPSWVSIQEQAQVDTFISHMASRILSMDTHDTLPSLDLCNEAYAPPTLYGCLLGYPVTYVVRDEDHAGRIARCLSTCTLVYHSVHAQALIHRDILPIDQMDMDEFETIMSFSVPQDSIYEAVVNQWHETMAKQHQWSGRVWRFPLRSSTFSTMRGIML
jgi:hypothetical protein